MKISVAFEGFFLDKELTFARTTIANYRRALGRFAQHVGSDKELEEISTADVRQYLIALRVEHGLSRRSVHDAWAILSSFWTWAEKILGMPHVIRGQIPAPEYTARAIEPFTEAEIQRLLKAAEYEREWITRKGNKARSKRPTAARERALVFTLLDSGLRASELCALTVGDYDAGRGRLRVRHGKGDKERYVVVGNRARKAIWFYLAGRNEPTPAEPLFTTRSGGPLDRNNLRHIVGRLGVTAGVDDVHPHRFRHTFAINFLRNGGNPLLLQELLGHERLETVRIYVKLAEQDINKAHRHSPADNWSL